MKTSAKYPGWKIEKEGRGYFMTHPQAPQYAVDVMPSKRNDGEWVADLMTRHFDKHSNSHSWESARNSFCRYNVFEVCAEALRRAEYWRSREGRAA